MRLCGFGEVGRTLMPERHKEKLISLVTQVTSRRVIRKWRKGREKTIPKGVVANRKA